MDPKVIAVLLIVLMFAAFLFVTPRGIEFREKYIDEHLGVLGSFFRSITSRTTGVTSGEKLSILITLVPISDLNNQKFELKGSGFHGSIVPEYVAFAGGSVTFPVRYVEVGVPNMMGAVSFANDRIRVEGETSQLSLNEMSFNTTSTDFTIIGVPVDFALNDIKKNQIIFPDLSGSLSWGGLKGVPPLLANDQLELIDFQGSIIMSENKITIIGFVSKMRLNGVNIGI